MTFDKETIVPIIQLMGYKKGNGGDVWKKQGDDCIYGVDFAKGEVFKFANGERILEDPDDEILNDTIQAVESGIDIHRFKDSTPKSNGGHNHDTGSRTMNQEVPAQTTEVSIPEKSYVPNPRQDTPQLDVATIKKYICPTATDKEAYAFMQLCHYRGLNPFLKEAYLLKYGNADATIVVGKDAFTRRAEDHLQFDGFEAGVIVENNGNIIEERQGTFVQDGEGLLGGWAKVYRKDRSHAFVSKVSMSEYNTNKSSWAKMPATMIRKVALVQALREAFPSDLGGMYDTAEMGVEV